MDKVPFRLGALCLLSLVLFACSEDPPIHRIPPQIAVEDEAEQPLTELAFGEVPVEDEAEERLFVRSVRPSVLEVKRLEIAGEGAEHFAVDEAGFPVGGENRAPVSVRFAPEAVGDWSATLVIHSNDRDKPRVEVALRGRGIDSAVRVEGCVAGDAALCAETQVFAPETLDLGGVVQGTVRNARITVTNLGRKPLELHEVVFEDPEAAEELGFTLPARTGGQTIGGLSSGGLTLGFDAPMDRLGEVEIALLVRTSDRSQPEVRFPIRATVLPNDPPAVCVVAREVVSWYSGRYELVPGEPVVINPGDRLIFDARVREGCTADLQDGEDVALSWTIETDDPFTPQLEVDLDPFVASFQAERIGIYRVRLTAKDSAGQTSSADEEGVPAEVEFRVEPQTDIGLEIAWPGSPGADLDIHLVRADGREGIFGANDFYWASGEVIWGDRGKLSSPHLAVDDKGALMVETVLLNAPEANQRYSLLVHMHRDGRSPRMGPACGSMQACGDDLRCSLTSTADDVGVCMPPVEVSARLFLKGKEFDLAAGGGLTSILLGSPCDAWHVGDVLWPDPPTGEPTFVPGLSVVLFEGRSVALATCSQEP